MVPAIRKLKAKHLNLELCSQDSQFKYITQQLFYWFTEKTNSLIWLRSQRSRMFICVDLIILSVNNHFQNHFLLIMGSLVTVITDYITDNLVSETKKEHKKNI